MLTQQTPLQKYLALKKSLDLPVKIRLYFLIFQNSLQPSMNTKTPRTLQQKKGFSKALLNAFNNMSSTQKGNYLLNNLNYILEQLDRQQKQKTKSDSKIDGQMDEIKNIQTSCQMLLTTFHINYWVTVAIKLDKIKKILNIFNKKKSFNVDMRHYFVRRSNKYKHSIVLQAINQEINNQGRKFVFCFTGQIVGKIYEEMVKCMYCCQNQKLLSLLAEEEEEDKDSHKSNQKALVFLSPKNINDYLAYKQKVQKQLLQNKFQFKPIFSHQNSHLLIQQSSKIQKIFRMQNIFQLPSKQLKQKFLASLHSKNKFITNSQVLQDFSKKYKAIYQKLHINGRIYEYISIRQQCLLPSTQQQILFIKGVQNIMGRNYIEFIQVKVRTINGYQSKLIVCVSIGLNATITKDVVKKFLIEFNQMIFRKERRVSVAKANGTDRENGNGINRDANGVNGTENCDDNIMKKNSIQKQVNLHQPQQQNQQNESGSHNSEQNDEDDDFMTVKGSQQLVGFIQDGVDPETEFPSQLPSPTKKSVSSPSYLQCPHIQTPFPLPLCPKYSKIMTQHYLFQQWKRVKNGGVICTNQAIISNQKRLFKEGITKLGKNILKGEILKISLPVVIFRKQSHLETIARNFCYAPMFFQKVAMKKAGQEIGFDLKLQRVKYATLLAISVGSLGISMQKPFNPILGQTLQMRINGCPIYLEQISHHPPIGAYLLEGRGYRLHGQIEPKINFGLNNVKGFSQRPNYLEFQDGTRIQMIYGKMIIKGMMFGDRQFNFQDRIYAYDQTNGIFSEIVYGPRKKSHKKGKDPLDFVYGTIYQVKPEFLPKFTQKIPRAYPTQQHIIKQLCTFEGIWNDQIKFSNSPHPYINFRTDLPYALVPEQNPLLSNSSFRSDLYTLIHSSLDQAQKEKDRLEELQRRDRKLREKGGK